MLRLILALFVVHCILPHSAFAADERKKRKGTKPEIASEEELISCEADVFFTWKRIIEPTFEVNQRGERIKVTPDPALVQPVEQFFTRAGAVAASETAATAELKEKLPAIEGKARAACSRQHESTAGCLKSRMENLAADYHSLDFGARKLLLDGIKKDCDGFRGVCLSTRSSDIQCATTIPPMLKTPEGMGAKEEKSDEPEEKAGDEDAKAGGGGTE